MQTLEIGAVADRILFIADDPAGHGGTEWGLIQTARGLPAQRWLPLVVVPARGPLHDMCIRAGLETRVLNFYRLPRGWRFRRHFPLDSWITIILNGARLKHLLRREGVALIQTSAKQSLNVRNLARVASAANVPLVWSCHDSNPQVLTHCSPWLGTRLSRVLAVSRYVKDELLRAGLGSEKKIEVLHNAIDLVDWDARGSAGSIRDELGIPPEAPVVALVGRLDRVKGQDLFLRAAERVAQEHANVIFLLIGIVRPLSRWAPFASYFEEVEALAKRPALQGRVRFLPWRTDLPRVMASLDILVQPSRRETFGRTLVEGMASQKPVIATRVGGMPEIVVDGETGLLVPRESPSALACSILSLLQDPKRQHVMGHAGRKRVEAHFGLPERLHRLEGIYLDVLRLEGAGTAQTVMAGASNEVKMQRQGEVLTAATLAAETRGSMENTLEVRHP